MLSSQSYISNRTNYVRYLGIEHRYRLNNNTDISSQVVTDQILSSDLT